ncbi:hypothetical protein CDL15_Pgr007768 [Punica granatum]|uniref:Uncharacterized protein n=1 Tax=Punica granatum TaxID=22663 RepID=A0A218XAJ1_PUNGR|nr:hypothetical protein CDL15_Pgr007768 [Punica granatum]
MDIALFSPSSLFADQDDSSSEAEEEKPKTRQSYVERRHQFPGMELVIREFSFHQLNANLLWPGTFAFAVWLVQDQFCLQGRRCIELGSGTGALAIFLRKSFNLDITTSDYDDSEIEENIAYNCRVNGISPALPHIKRECLLIGYVLSMGFLIDSWGDTFPEADPDWDLIIASDILLYVKQYPNLIKTLCFLLKSYKPRNKESAASEDFLKLYHAGSILSLPRPTFLMSWRRRIGKEEESLFFNGCEEAGLVVKHIVSRVYCVSLKKLQ